MFVHVCSQVCVAFLFLLVYENNRWFLQTDIKSFYINYTPWHFKNCTWLYQLPLTHLYLIQLVVVINVKRSNHTTSKQKPSFWFITIFLSVDFDSCNNLIVHYLYGHNVQLQQWFWSLRGNTYINLFHTTVFIVGRNESKWELLEKCIKQECGIIFYHSNKCLLLKIVGFYGRKKSCHTQLWNPHLFWKHTVFLIGDILFSHFIFFPKLA